MRAAVEASGAPQDRLVLQRVLARQRCVQSLRRARLALLAGDVTSARAHALAAYRQRVTLRSVSVLAGLWLAPRLLRKLRLRFPQYVVQLEYVARSRSSRHAVI